MTELPQVTRAERNLIMVCVEDHPKAMTLLRAAASHARNQGKRWCAVFVETPAHLTLEQDGSQERMLRLLTVAKQMGGETQHVEAETVEQGIARQLEARRDTIALLIVGSTESANWLEALRPALWERIARVARRERITVEAVPLSKQNYRKNLRERLRWIRPRHLIYSLVAVGVAYVCASLLEMILPPALFRINSQNIGLLFMTACAFTAGRFGLLPGLVASVASFLTINYFFTSPYHMLRFGSITDLLNMAIFLTAALLISLFTSQTRGFAEKAAKRELSTQLLFTLYRTASVASSRQQALERLQEKLTQMLEMDVAFFLPESVNSEHIEPAAPADLKLEKNDYEALRLSWRDVKTTGLASPFNTGTKWRFEAMLAPGGEIGVLGIRPRAGAELDAWFGKLIAAIADQTAAIIEHIELERSMEETHISQEREKLRSLLLSSVSHDLKTPLASIIGALSIYRSQGVKLSAEKRSTLIETALEEAERLDSFITNILAMTHLESGKIEFKQDWQDSGSFVNEVVRRLESHLRKHQITVHPATANIEVYMDRVMTDQVLQNLLDNACKYTPSGTSIEIRATEDSEKGFCIEVRDHGPGLPPDKMEQAFDKYARLQMKDSRVAGTGLGLAICKAIMEAQAGSVTVANHAEGGAVFTLCLPKWRKAEHKKYVA